MSGGGQGGGVPGGNPEGKKLLEKRCAVTGCTGLAVFGYDASLLRGLDGRWYCRAHRPGLSAPAAPAAVPPSGKQGRLL